MSGRLLARAMRWARWAAPLLMVVFAATLALATIVYWLRNDTLGIDFIAYFDAAVRLGGGASPYLPDLLAGTATTADSGQYLYPPPLAQLLIPFTWLGRDAGYALFSVLTVAAFIVAVVALWRTAGGRVTPRGAILAWAAIACTVPLYSTVVTGNVGLIVASLTAISITSSPLLSGALGALLKLVPGALLLMERPRRSSRRVAVTVALIVAGSIALSPVAWRTYLLEALPATISNDDPIGRGGSPAALARLAGTVLEIRTDGASNPKSRDVLSRAGWTNPIPDDALKALAALETPLRGVSLLLSAALLLEGARAARDRSRRHVAAAHLTVGGLLVPWTLWDHYLVALLPISLIAWRLGDGRARASLVAGFVLLSPLATSLVGPYFWLVPAMALLLDGIRRTRLPEPEIAAR